ncbi:MAG TPA: hypothetical protein VFC78_24240 [Tepidisphaeraceae bacterium]|nr:hypothetical protein [Tepidisphaeraceae bacterium]
MDSHKLALKLYVTDPSALNAGDFVPLFHSWIQQHKVPDHLLIDVADYQHVPDGPGTMLISYEANFAMDVSDGRLGLLYVRKQPFAGAHTFAQRLRATFKAELEAVARLEEDPKLAGRMKFATGEILLQINDRLLGPNNPQTFAEVKEDLESVFTELYGVAPLAMDYRPSPESLFQVRVKLPASPPAAKLLERLNSVSLNAGFRWV